MLLHFLAYLIPVLVGTTAVLWLGTRFWRPWTAQEEQKQSFEHATALVRTLFAFTLAFVVVQVWQSYAAGDQTVITETGALTEVNWAARELPADQRDGLRQRMATYSRKVIDQEWPTMETRFAMDPDTRRTWDDLRRYAGDLPTVDARTTMFQQRVLTQLEKAGDARRQRGVQAASGLPPLLWIGLLVGAVLMVILPTLWGTRFTARTVLLHLALAASLTGMLFLVSQMNHAFSGDIRVPPTAFQALLDRLDRIA